MRLAPLLTLATLAAAPLAALAAPPECTDPSALALSPPIVSVRVDNDLFANQDQGYTSGAQLTLVSPNLASYTNDPCLPRPARLLNRYLDIVQPEGFEQQNMIVRVTQGIFTPNDPARSDLVVEDRPYAGLLYVTFGYNARKGDVLRTTLLGLGMMGPSSHAEQVQDAIHDLTGSEHFQGWDHQLDDEVLFGIRHERSYRVDAGTWGDNGYGHDAITHWGAAFGNAMTRVNSGFELRVGRHLPDDFGSSPVRPAGDNTAPPSDGRVTPGWAWHAFLAFDAYWAIYDATLDGNAFQRSHHVDKRPLVAESAVGFALTHRRWKLAFARYFRTREFDAQRERPAFGSFTVSRLF